MESHLTALLQVSYAQNFEQIRALLDTGKETIRQAIAALTHVCHIWSQYDELNETFVVWLNQTEQQLNAYQNDEQNATDELRRLQETMLKKDKQLQELEELELSIRDYDWSRQAHNTTMLRERCEDHPSTGSDKGET